MENKQPNVPQELWQIQHPCRENTLEDVEQRNFVETRGTFLIIELLDALFYMGGNTVAQWLALPWVRFRAWDLPVWS